MPERVSIHFSQGIAINNEDDKFSEASLRDDGPIFFKTLTAEQAKVQKTHNRRGRNSRSVPAIPRMRTSVLHDGHDRSLRGLSYDDKDLRRPYKTQELPLHTILD